MIQKDILFFSDEVTIFFFLDHTSQYLHKLNTYICSYLLPQYEISSKSCFDFEIN